jgi:hypothetical protein
LIDFVFPLVEALRYEQYHDSELACFLIRRSLVSPRFGLFIQRILHIYCESILLLRMLHFVFWYCKIHCTGPAHRNPTRYRVVLDALVGVIGSFARKNLMKQVRCHASISLSVA